MWKQLHYLIAGGHYNTGKGDIYCNVFFSYRSGPDIVGVPQNQITDIGASVTFNCTATGLPAPNISWIKNNDSFALQSNPRVTFINDPLDDKSTQSHLFITRVKEEDFGKYQCEAKNSGDKNLSLPAFLTPKVSGQTFICISVCFPYHFKVETPRSLPLACQLSHPIEIFPTPSRRHKLGFWMTASWCTFPQNIKKFSISLEYDVS